MKAVNFGKVRAHFECIKLLNEYRRGIEAKKQGNDPPIRLQASPKIGRTHESFREINNLFDNTFITDLADIVLTEINTMINQHVQELQELGVDTTYYDPRSADPSDM